jgi:hypothetical protein
MSSLNREFYEQYQFLRSCWNRNSENIIPKESPTRQNCKMLQAHSWTVMEIASLQEKLSKYLCFDFIHVFLFTTVWCQSKCCCLLMCVCVRACVRACVRMYVCMYVCMHACMYVCIIMTASVVEGLESMTSNPVTSLAWLRSREMLW